jgi:hypothetical protein
MFLLKDYDSGNLRASLAPRTSQSHAKHNGPVKVPKSCFDYQRTQF